MLICNHPKYVGHLGHAHGLRVQRDIFLLPAFTHIGPTLAPWDPWASATFSSRAGPSVHSRTTAATSDEMGCDWLATQTRNWTSRRRQHLWTPALSLRKFSDIPCTIEVGELSQSRG